MIHSKEELPLRNVAYGIFLQPKLYYKTTRLVYNWFIAT